MTCTKGTVIKKVEEKSGTWIFGGLDVGTWTVKAILDSSSASKNVDITSDLQSVFVTLSYKFYLIKDGQKQVDFDQLTYSATITWGSTGVSFSGDTAQIRTKIKIPIAGYTKLIFEYTGSSNTSEIGLSTSKLSSVWTTFDVATLKLVATSTKEVKTLDVANAAVGDNPEYFIGYYNRISGCTVYNMWLE